MNRRVLLRWLAALSSGTPALRSGQSQDDPHPGFDVPAIGSLLVTVKDRMDSRQTHIRHVILDPLSWSDLISGFAPIFWYSADAKNLFVAISDVQDRYTLAIIDFTNARAPQAFPYPASKTDWRSSPQIALSPDGKRLYTLRSRIHAARSSSRSLPRGTFATDLDASYDELVLLTFDLTRMAFLPLQLPEQSSQFGTDQPFLDWQFSVESGGGQIAPFTVRSARRRETYVVEPGQIILQKQGHSTMIPIQPAPDGFSLHHPALGADDQFLFVPVGPAGYTPRPGNWTLRTYYTDTFLKVSEISSPRPIFRLASARDGRTFFDAVGGKIQVLESATLGLIREVAFDGEEVTSIYVVP